MLSKPAAPVTTSTMPSAPASTRRASRFAVLFSFRVQAWWITFTWSCCAPWPMMTRIHWGKIIPARWFSLVALAAALAAFAAAPPKRPIARAVTAPRPASGGSTGALAALVRGYREAPSAARRAAVEAYADAHAKETGGSLARLALGVVAYEQKQFPDAVAALRPIATQLPAIADYTAYFLGA